MRLILMGSSDVMFEMYDADVCSGGWWVGRF
jgi:hypothetical protein